MMGDSVDKGIKLTREQVFAFAFLGIIGNIVYVHTWIDDATDRSAWVASITGILLIIPFALWLLYLGKLRPQNTVFDILESCTGKVFAGMFRILFIIVNFALSVAQLNMFTEMLHVFFFEYTPSWIIMLLLVSVGALIISDGIITFGRLVEFLAALGIINYFASFAFSFTKFHILYFYPIFDTPVIGFMKGAAFMMGASSECLLLFLVIVGNIPDSLKHHKWVVSGIALGSVIFSLAIFIIMAIMSPELAKRIAFGGVNAARTIKIGEFLQGLEVFVFATYQFIAVGKAAMCLYCSWISTTRMFGNRKPKLQLIFLAILLLIPSVWLNSYNKAYFLAVFCGKYITLPYIAFVLLLTSVLLWIKNKRSGSASL